MEVDFNDLNIVYNFKMVAVQLLVIGGIFLLIEQIRPTHKTFKFFSKEFKKELGLAFLNGSIFNPVFGVAVTFIIVTYLKEYLPHQIFDEYITLTPLVIQALVGMFIIDLSTYWRHRLTHNYAWRYHSMHHSAEEITWITALRLHPVEILIATFFDTVILYIIGFSGDGIIFASILGGLYNFFTHANINFEFDKPLRYIFASPNFHRWHHATNKEAYDKNFCGIFSCIDIMFGTYYYPEGKLPDAYGLSAKEQAQVPAKLLPHIFQSFKRKKS